MKASYRWVRRRSGSEQSPEELAETMTFLGLNVEEIAYLGSRVPAGARMAEILEVERRPDGLAVCRIDDGAAGATVASRAPNVRPGIFVPYVPPGVAMPDGHIVEAVEFGSVISAGILCSAAELGVPGGPSEYLLEVDEAVPGADVVVALGLDDWTFDLDLTPNYATHCQSVIGIAREVSAAEGRRLEIPVSESPGNADAPRADIVIEDSDLCPRYSAVAVSGITVAPSPWWIQRDLLASGVRPINNIVDATNHVMLETGQPLHAFDLDRLGGERIVVRRARAGEKLVTLDGRARTLDPSDLVIADERDPVGLAGVMGGENSEVHEGTSRIILESAHFDATNVLKTARRLGLQTDASLRFEKGCDPEATLRALHDFLELLEEISPASAAGPVEDVRPRDREPVRLPLDAERVNAFLGTELGEDRMRAYLELLGFTACPEGVEVPSWRADVRIPVDLTEEVARMHGYNEIPASLPRTAVTGYVPGRGPVAEDAAVEYLVGAGFSEIATRSWMPAAYLRVLDPPEDHPHRHLVPVSNPMRDDQSRLRSTLLGDALEVLAAGSARERGAHVFELSRVYVPRELPPVSLPEEPKRLCLAASGRVRASHWMETDTPPVDFFHLKGVVEGLLGVLAIEEAVMVPSEAYYMYPGRAARVECHGSVLGEFGELHPEIARRADLDSPVVIGEFDFDALVCCAGGVPRVQPAPVYPASGRDIALVVPEETMHREVVRCIEESAGDLLEEIHLFDVYRGDPIPSGSKSMAYHLRYRSPDRTLTDEEVEVFQDRVRGALRRDLGADLRS